MTRSSNDRMKTKTNRSLEAVGRAVFTAVRDHDAVLATAGISGSDIALFAE